MLVLDEKELLLENKNLEYVNGIIKLTLSKMGSRVLKQQEKIKEFQNYMWSNTGHLDVQELAVIRTSSDMEANILLKEHKYFMNLYKIENSPYFGAITFEDENKSEKIYIGFTYLRDKDSLDNIIYDWRSPICSLFYDYEIGPCSYEAPIGTINGYLNAKRQYNIKNGKLIRMFDNSLSISDDVLQEVLEKESSDKMENIVNTIQKEQNQIIRGNEYKNLIIQGVAGSGKTSVALHRIAYLLYKIENLSSRNVLIFSPNDVFTEYISNVLPEIGEDNTLQTTFSDYLKFIITEYKDIESFSNFISRYYTYRNNNEELIIYKQSDGIIKDLENYIKNYEDSAKFQKNILEDNRYFYGIDELNELLKNRYGTLPLMKRIKEISDKLSETNYKGKRTKSKVFQKLLKESSNFNIDYKTIYKEFFTSKYCKLKLSIEEINEFVNKKKLNYEDALLFSYMKGLLNGFHYEQNILQVVIDEAQDYSILQYKIISKIFKKANFTILGDVNQTINPYYKYENLNILNDISKGNYLELNKSYRSSTEIIEYTNNLLNLNNVSAIRSKSGQPITYRKNESYLKEDINQLKEKHKSIAIITKDDFKAENIYDLLSKEYDITKIDSTSKIFTRNLIIIPAYMSKGLEFDSVIVLDSKSYKNNELNLLYVACTRAQHELIIYE